MGKRIEVNDDDTSPFDGLLLATRFPYAGNEGIFSEGERDGRYLVTPGLFLRRRRSAPANATVEDVFDAMN